MAMIVGVTRSQWSMYELGIRNLPGEASLRLAQLHGMLMASEDKSAKIEQLKLESATRKKVLKKLWLRNQYRQEKLSRQFDAAQQKLDNQERLPTIIKTLDLHLQNKQDAPPRPYLESKITSAKIEKNARKVFELQLKLELLGHEEQILAREIKSV
jgi:transcriptional regulator with XRE-family HTH domain